MNQKEWLKEFKNCRYKWAARHDYPTTDKHGNLMCAIYYIVPHRCMFIKCPLIDGNINSLSKEIKNEYMKKNK